MDRDALIALVRRAAEIIRQSSSDDDPTLRSKLVDAGMSESDAAEFTALIPTAFCRLHLQRLGMTLETACLIYSEVQGPPSRVDLWDLEVFEVASELAQEWLSTGIAVGDFLAVAGRAAEFRTINAMLLGGSKLADIRLTDLALLGLKSIRMSRTDRAAPPQAVATKPWWRCW